MFIIVLLYIVLFRPGTTTIDGVGVAATSRSTFTHEKLETLSESAVIIPEQYIITLSKSVVDINEFIVSLLALYNEDDDNDDEIIQFVYNFMPLPSSTTTTTSDPIRGMTISNVNNTTLQWLMANNVVVTITPDYMFHLDNVQMEPENWGLDRIDSISGSDTLDGQYHYNNHVQQEQQPADIGTTDVDVYVLDTGLYMSHTDFTTIIDPVGIVNSHQKLRNITCGYDVFENDCVDTNGHGTHIAGIIGGIHHGVAKHSNLISVKVYDDNYGGASLSTILAGLQYVSDQKILNPTRPAIINFSISGPTSNTMNMITTHVVNTCNVTMVVSAGNDATSSCTKSPSSSELPIITVSATNRSDILPPYANYGPCTNIMAPGHEITSAWIRDPHDAAILSGTSLAAAHVSGVAALHLQRNPEWAPYDVWLAIKKDALLDIIPNIPESTPNLLLNIGILNYL